MSSPQTPQDSRLRDRSIQESEDRDRKVTTLVPGGGIEWFDWRELIEYRDLLYFMVRRDIRSRYAQSILGLGWAVLRPLLTVVIFTVVFGTLANIDSDGLPYPLFSNLGVVPWTYFAASLSAAANSLVGNALVSKVYFPRIIIPLAPVFSNLLDFAIAFFLLIPPMMLYYGYAPQWTAIFLPLLVLLMMMSATGIGIWLAALAVQYRDVKFALSFVVSMLMYVAPVAWPASEVPERFRLLYGLYPMAGVIEGFRSLLLGATPIPYDLLIPGTCTSLLLLVTGAIYFSHRQGIYADVH